MMKTRNLLRAGLLVGTSAAALGLGGALGPAKAFDDVDWTWTNDVVETVDVDLDIANTLAPTGLTQLEAVQIMVGDVSATDSIGTVINNPPGQGNGDGTVSGSFTFATENYESEGAQGPWGTNQEGEITSQSGGLAGADVEVVGGTLNEQTNELDFTANVSGIPVTLVGEPTTLAAATDLPEVSSSATALANQRAIESDTATMIHDAQYAFGDFSGELGELEAGAIADVYENASENEHFSGALALVTAGATGTITPASITANSSVDTVVNGSVDAEAQAFANVHSVDVDTSATDGIVIADLNQMAYADVAANQSVGSVTVSNYTGLGDIDGALVDSSALAAGNVSNVTVGTPTIDTQ